MTSSSSFVIALRYGNNQKLIETVDNPTVSLLRTSAKEHFGKKLWRFSVFQGNVRTRLDYDSEVDLAIKGGILARPLMTITVEEESNPEWDDPRPWHLRGPFS